MTEDLLNVLRNNKGLKEIDLCVNVGSISEEKALLRALELNQSLTSVVYSLDCTRLTAPLRFATLQNVLLKNPRLMRVKIKANSRELDDPCGNLTWLRSWGSIASVR